MRVKCSRHGGGGGLCYPAVACRAAALLATAQAGCCLSPRQSGVGFLPAIVVLSH